MLMLILMLWPLAVIPGVSHFGEYHRPRTAKFPCKLSFKFTCSLRNPSSTSFTSAAAFLFTFSCIDFYDQQRKHTEVIQQEQYGFFVFHDDYRRTKMLCYATSEVVLKTPLLKGCKGLQRAVASLTQPSNAPGSRTTSSILLALQGPCSKSNRQWHQFPWIFKCIYVELIHQVERDWLINSDGIK